MRAHWPRGPSWAFRRRCCATAPSPSGAARGRCAWPPARLGPPRRARRPASAGARAAAAPGLEDSDPGCGHMRMGQLTWTFLWPALAAASGSGSLMSWVLRLPPGAVWAWRALPTMALLIGSWDMRSTVLLQTCCPGRAWVLLEERRSACVLLAAGRRAAPSSFADRNRSACSAAFASCICPSYLALPADSVFRMLLLHPGPQAAVSTPVEQLFAARHRSEFCMPPPVPAGYLTAAPVGRACPTRMFVVHAVPGGHSGRSRTLRRGGHPNCALLLSCRAFLGLPTRTWPWEAGRGC